MLVRLIIQYLSAMIITISEDQPVKGCVPCNNKDVKYNID